MDSKTPALLLRGLMIFPGNIRPVTVGRPSSVAAIHAHLKNARPLVLLSQLDSDAEDPLNARFSKIAVMGQVLRVTKLPDGSLRVLIEGVERVLVPGSVESVDEASVCEPVSLVLPEEDPIRLSAMSGHIADLFERLMSEQGLQIGDRSLVSTERDDPHRLCDQVMGQIDTSYEAKLRFLQEPRLGERQAQVLQHLAITLAKQGLAEEINGKVSKAMDSAQREYQLREQLNVIRAELGEKYGTGLEIDAFEEKLKLCGMPEQGLEEALREVSRLRHINSDSAEYTIARTWVEALIAFPWSTATTDTKDLVLALQTLDAAHYGLKKVKARIVEYLAVRQLNPQAKGAILCFVGPPGVGKTSLGRSIAEALGRSFGRIALGGVKDESEIRGHRRTYIGALPGRIVRAMTRAKSNNPVLVLDEIDKVGTDVNRGDPSSALLEVLDPEQNSTFNDHYLDIAVDLSKVLFIATANLTSPIPAALQDRLEIIELPGYTEEEKVHIAERYLLPKLAVEHGLVDHNVRIGRTSLQRVIRDYTREAGVREFERKLAAIHRKLARQIVEGRSRSTRVNVNQLKAFLGPQRFFSDAIELSPQPGIVTGLAWTAAGGEILFIEAAKMPGKHALKLTGSLGDVMKESAEAAMTWLRSNARHLEIDDSAFDAQFHLHVPAGAIPKDGPSAGGAIATALASLITGRRVKTGFAMTGELTLRGRILPVGGVKEKALAARRAGVTTIILPAKNEVDLEDIPASLRKDLTFHFVQRVDEVLKLALE